MNMHNPEFDKRLDHVKERARGHWVAILDALGIDDKVLNRRNQPCPLIGCSDHGGTDRFQFTDRFGEGNFICRKCGAGDGFKLLQGIHGWTFLEAFRAVERHVGCTVLTTTSPAEVSTEKMKKLAQRIWNESSPLKAGDEVDRYLRNRGLALPHLPRSLRLHPNLGYYEKQGAKSVKTAEYPAMVGVVRDKAGCGVTLHRTYLLDGVKAPVSDCKKLLNSGVNGAAIRLFEALGKELAIAEGIETALAVRLATSKPVWSAINCGNLEKIWIPETVEKICIYADNDADSQFDGQASAFVLARRLLSKEALAASGVRRTVQVFVPKQSGQDWADVWVCRQHAQSQHVA